MSKTPPLLDELLRTGAPSGYEAPAAEVWRQAASFAELSTDGLGSSIARVGEEAPLVAVVGHIDEIGLVVTHIDEKGFLWFAPIGGWDPQILVGQRVEVRGRDGLVPGVVGRKPIHLLEPDQRKKVVELKGLHIDVGADVDVQSFQFDDLLALVGLEQVDRLAADDAGDEAVAAPHLDPLADQDLRVPAADWREPEEALLVDVGDDEADLVDVADHGDQRRFLADTGDRGAEPVGRELRERCRLTPDLGRRRLVPGGRAGAKKFVE